MNIAAIIEKIKAGLKKFSGGKSAEPTPTAKDRKTTEHVKAPAPRKDEKKIPSATKSAPKKAGKKKTSTGKKPQTKR